MSGETVKTLNDALAAMCADGYGRLKAYVSLPDGSLRPVTLVGVVTTDDEVFLMICAAAKP